MLDAVCGYPRRDIDAAERLALIHGKAIAAARIDGPYAAVDGSGLVAMLHDEGEEARSLCVLTQS